VTLIDLSVSLIGVLIALPAALVIAAGAVEGDGRERPAHGRGLRAALGRLGGRGSEVSDRRGHGEARHEPV
jgi:hypothetical protein